MRTEFSAKVRVEAFKRCGGHCEECGIKLRTGNIHYDHRIPDGLGGAADLANCSVLCRGCHSDKTRTQDVPAIAKAKRIERRHIGIKKPRTIRAWRKFNGKEVFATRER